MLTKTGRNVNKNREAGLAKKRARLDEKEGEKRKKRY